MSNEKMIIEIEKILRNSECVADSQEFGLSYGQAIEYLEEIKDVLKRRQSVKKSNKPSKVDILLEEGETIDDACKRLGVSRTKLYDLAYQAKRKVQAENKSKPKTILKVGLVKTIYHKGERSFFVLYSDYTTGLETVPVNSREYEELMKYVKQEEE